VSDLIALDAKTVAYRIYDEHEHRYYRLNGDAFFPGASYPPDPREQYDLGFSPDGKLATYAERRWGELTYLVIVDLLSRKRTEAKVFGSCPKAVPGAVYFLSDPTFVQTKHRAFRQIRSFALYRYDVVTGSFAPITTFEDSAQLLVSALAWTTDSAGRITAQSRSSIRCLSRPSDRDSPPGSHRKSSRLRVANAS
jgi:hypothetical protein